jgi:hypothetical protein
MSITPGTDGKRTVFATIGLLLLPMLCCGLPALIVAGALGTVGSWLRSPWLCARLPAESGAAVGLENAIRAVSSRFAGSTASPIRRRCSTRWQAAEDASASDLIVSEVDRVRSS